MIMSQTQQVHPLSHGIIMEDSNQLLQQPNIIGNAEDQTAQMNQFNNVVVSDDSNEMVQPEILMVPEGDSYKEVPPIKARSRRKGSKAHF